MSNDKNATVYVDGFNLYYGMVEKGWQRYKWLDLYNFSLRIIPNGYQLSRVWYFTSRIKGNVNKHNRQQTYLNALATHNGENINIRYGNYQTFDTHCKYCGEKPIYCRNCGNVYSKPNEKKTDVNVATYMLTDCIEGLTDCVLLVSGDSDYEAPLLEIKRLYPHVQRVTAFPPRRRNPFLEGLCNESFDIAEASFAESQLPNPVISKKTGKKYTKPTEW